MIEELEDVILTCDLPEHGLTRGDIGTVVLVHKKGKGYEVEFTTLDGELNPNCMKKEALLLPARWVVERRYLTIFVSLISALSTSGSFILDLFARKAHSFILPVRQYGTLDPLSLVK